jgi:hypothetical protein
MPKPDPIETILARLMPPALSATSQHRIESMLDSLAQSSTQASTSRPHHRFSLHPMLSAGIAAAGVAAALIFSLTTRPTPASLTSIIPNSPPRSEFILVSESDRVESMIDEGWQENPDGSTLHALRINVVEENSLLDEETGIVMQVSEPREELLLMPVSTF